MKIRWRTPLPDSRPNSRMCSRSHPYSWPPIAHHIPAQLASGVRGLPERFERSTPGVADPIAGRARPAEESLAGRREKEFSDFGVFASGLRAGADEMHRLLVDLRQVSTALESSLDDLSGEVSVAGDQQRSLLTAFGNLERVTSSAIRSDQSVMRQLAAAASSLSETADKTISGADAAAQGSRAAADAVRGIASSLSRFLRARVA